MSLVKGTLSLTCSKCGKQHEFTPEDTDFEVTSTEERPMGLELCHSWEHSFNCDSDVCEDENEIEIEYEIWEYPQGVLNTDKVDIIGGTEVGRFSYDFQEEQEDEE